LFNLRDELTKNPSIHTEDHVELIEFRYTVNSNNNTDTDLLESSFNPLFFIKNMDINIKNIYTNIKKIYTNIKNLINKNILITNLIKDLKSILIIINNNKILKLLLGILIIYLLKKILNTYDLLIISLILPYLKQNMISENSINKQNNNINTNTNTNFNVEDSEYN